MIEIVFLEEEEGPIEIAPDSRFNRLSSLGKTPDWLFCITAIALAAIGFASRRRRTSSEFFPDEPVGLSSRDLQIQDFEVMQARFFSSKGAPLVLPVLQSNLPPCSPEDKKRIEEVLSILDENSSVSIVSKVSRLDELESELDPVHPLVFLLVIFSDRALKDKVRRIFDNFFKITHQVGFLRGVEKGFGNKKMVELDPYLEAWAIRLNTTKSRVRPLIQRKDWRGLVLHLLQV